MATRAVSAKLDTVRVATETNNSNKAASNAEDTAAFVNHATPTTATRTKTDGSLLTVDPLAKMAARLEVGRTWKEMRRGRLIAEHKVE